MERIGFRLDTGDSLSVLFEGLYDKKTNTVNEKIIWCTVGPDVDNEEIINVIKNYIKNGTTKLEIVGLEPEVSMDEYIGGFSEA